MKQKISFKKYTDLGVTFTVNPNLKPIPKDHPVMVQKMEKANNIISNLKGIDKLFKPA